MARKRANTHEATDPRQLETIANPRRQDMLARLSASGPLSMRELADQVGARPTALYHHLEKLLAVGLVLFTTVAVGYLAHYLIGLPLAAGFVLGAIVSPPDAIAARVGEQGYGVTVVDPRWVRPVPVELVALAREHRLVVTVEDGVRGGVGDALARALRDVQVPTPVRDLAVPPDWHPHGTRAQILADLGLTAQDVARDVIEAVSRLEPQAGVLPAARTASP